jgi:ribose transport system substrate-binding protein
VSTSVASAASRIRSRGAKIVALTLIAGLAGGALAGCSDARPDAGESTDAPIEKLAAFDPNVPDGTKPDLPFRLGIPGDFEGIELSRWLRESAESRGVDVTQAVSNGDLVEFRTQAETMFAQGVGAWWKWSGYESDDIETEALDAGILTVGVTTPNVHSQIGGDFFALGKTEGLAAANWAAEALNGKGEVVILAPPSDDSRIKTWIEGIRSGIATQPGLSIVSDSQTVQEGADAADTMATLLQAHPGINIVIGHSGGVGGALATFEAQGRGNDPTVFLTAHEVGPELLGKMIEGDSILRSGIANPWPLYGWAYGQIVADWLEGKSVPRLLTLADEGYLDLNTPELASQYLEDMQDPAATWNDPDRRDRYIALWGNVSYDTRDEYWHEALFAVNDYVDRAN